MAAQETRVSGMAGRYAQALFLLCQETGTTEKAAADLAAFAELVRSSADLQRFVKSPVFLAEEQVKALNALLARAEIAGIAGCIMPPPGPGNFYPYWTYAPDREFGCSWQFGNAGRTGQSFGGDAQWGTVNPSSDGAFQSAIEPNPSSCFPRRQ